MSLMRSEIGWTFGRPSLLRPQVSLGDDVRVDQNVLADAAACQILDETCGAPDPDVNDSRPL